MKRRLAGQIAWWQNGIYSTYIWPILGHPSPENFLFLDYQR